MNKLEIWGGPECTVNRVGARYFDQLQRSGHDLRLDDLDRFASLKLGAIRYPVLWERHAPVSLEDIDLAWADARLERLRASGIAPIVGLVHHGSGPGYTSLADPDFPVKLGRYARAVAERYPWVTSWTPVNEPLTTARFSGMYGHWYPHGRDASTFVQTLFNQLRGVILAMREIRSVNPDARLVQTEDVGVADGSLSLAAQVAHEHDRRWLTWDLLTGRVTPEHPLWGYLRSAGASDDALAFFREHATPPQIIGLNYYLTSDRWLDDRLDAHPAAFRGGNGELAYADVEAVRFRADGIVGHEQHLTSVWQRYGIPLAMTEVHLGCSRDEQLRWLAEAWTGAHAARSHGVDVRAITAWALLGSYDWDSLVTEPRGYYEPGAFDVRAAEPRPTALATAIRELADGGPISHPVARNDGWWRRSGRLLSNHIVTDRSLRRQPDGPPVVVFGASGTLGRAFARVCGHRGLAIRAVNRAEVDATDAAGVDAILRRVQPWAVVNAAGYVRVDEAEADEAACRRGNVAATTTIAAACRRRALRMVAFSSDLVFDGAKRTPYDESDPIRPLNVYGASKAEMEERVLDILPGTLIVRTSAFFGPWDEANFATQLWRALGRGTPFAAADDYVVSPTYVPHLVDAVLDLLIDGESGVWHLANEGALTWWEFGRQLAERGGLDASLVIGTPARQVWSPAVRPRFSALTSRRGGVMPSLAGAIEEYVGHMIDTSADRERRLS